ncbi:MAG: hypothetical protein E6Z13_09470, partial [Dermabacter sp.]|nr:hypothetical protein [Dermabacter sp.]
MSHERPARFVPRVEGNRRPRFPHSCSELQKPLIAPPRPRMPEDGRVAGIDVRGRIARVQYEYGDAAHMGFTPELTGSLTLAKQADGSWRVTNLARGKHSQPAPRKHKREAGVD